ncbi:glycosyltransferase [Scopulibacillus cellulosilyticus]|uniref:Glycosyltransferase n=1 Tax=Scopulibacillus cellulosilyticus TaxID=2665665 RepID=A0ABW2PXH4_9BACL
MSKAAGFLNKTATVIKSNTTRKGTYYLFSVDGKKIGWLDKRAFTFIEETSVIYERTVKRIAEVNLKEDDGIWTKPCGLEGATEIEHPERYNGEKVIINKEIRTQLGTFCRFAYNKSLIGWLDKRSFNIIETVGIEVGGSIIPEPSRNHFNFLNMGRLSPEKGQDNLIKAFAKFNKTQPNSRLYILGDGPLKNDLQDLIIELDLQGAVYLTGQQENPFRILKKCDCFVLSSHYEGQPMVLLEAMTLGMKIVATDIVANRTVLENGKYGILVENSIEGLESGLYMATNDETVNQIESFDYEKYNHKAMGTFYKVLG